jgi:hypothetical protein
MRVSDYVIQFLRDNYGVDTIFTVSGGGCIFLIDSLGSTEGVKYVATHHEQAAAIAAEGYARMNDKLGACIVTSGPGGTNAITGTLCSWLDSIPVITISGQVNKEMTTNYTKLPLRQLGDQEFDIIQSVKNMTKYAAQVNDPLEIRYHLEKSCALATTGRPGPVWVDIPLIVRYQTYDEVEEYPLSIDWNNVKNDRNSYMNNEIMFVQDIKNLDKHGNSGKSKYLGPNLIGQHEMDYATDDEIFKVQMCLLFQMIKTYDFNEVMSEHPLFEKYLEYSEKFIHTTLFLDNPKIQEYSVTYGCTVCPEMVKFPNKQCSMISFKDIVCGVIEGDIGREDFNRTTTKVNLHHVDRLISGKLNHNHKNVFLGSATGNMINAALFIRGCEVSDLFNG